MTADATTRRAIEATWRVEAARIIAVVARMTRDVVLAEEMAQDALVAALEHWPVDGVPRNPAAWLTATAKRRALDSLRHQSLAARKHLEIGLDLEAQQALVVPDLVDALLQAEADPIGDDLLRLIFTACHPVLSRDAQLALTLRLLGGLSTDEIARAFLVSEATIAQRIVRAKRTLAAARVAFELPGGDALDERLAAVLEVIYLLFNEGYAATSGDDWMRPTLLDEALRLGRLLTGLAPDEPEVHALLALMELQASRVPARLDAAGRPVLLLDQDRSRWDRLLIRHGLTALARAESLGGGRGSYALQAAIAACHARAAQAQQTDWRRIGDLYDELMEVAPSPVVALNRAVAVGMGHGPQAGLDLLDGLADEAALTGYPWLDGARADLLDRLGRHGEAAAAFLRAATLTRNDQDADLLRERARVSAATARQGRPESR